MKKMMMILMVLIVSMTTTLFADSYVAFTSQQVIEIYESNEEEIAKNEAAKNNAKKTNDKRSLHLPDYIIPEQAEAKRRGENYLNPAFEDDITHYDFKGSSEPSGNNGGLIGSLIDFGNAVTGNVGNIYGGAGDTNPAGLNNSENNK